MNEWLLPTREKLAILSDAAKYDASCASSGAAKRNSLNSGGIGSTEGMGICHSYAPDGRCISLLKILLTNFCIYDCSYCINRSSSNVRRARFTVDEVVQLTMTFYKRNYIEGLFLRPALSARPTRQWRETGRGRAPAARGREFRRLHPPEDDSRMLARSCSMQAGHYADRLSINIELPTDEGVKRLAPEKRPETIRLSMAALRSKIEEKSRADAEDEEAPALRAAAASRRR